MALPSRLGAFVVGTAVGATQSFYWLYHDVYAVQSALLRKLDTVRSEVTEKAHQADLRLAAAKDAASAMSKPAPTSLPTNSDGDSESDTSNQK